MPSMNSKVRAGETASVAFKRLQSAMSLDAPRLVSAPSIKRTITPHGTLIKLFKQDWWDHPFRLSANDDYFSVSPGTVNGILPYIKSASTGEFLRLNGFNQQGQFDYDSGSLPIAKMDLSKANDDGGIYVMVRIKRNKSFGGFGTKLDDEGQTTATEPEDIQIVLEKEFEGPTAAGPDEDFGYHPIGFIQLTASLTSVLSFSQVTHFNLRYDFQDRRATLAELALDPKRLTIGRHIFYQV